MPEGERASCSSTLSAVEVTVDSFCIECGYNLRGLTRQGLCPECGTLKLASLRPDLLQYADPAWRDSICRGLTLLSVGLGLFAACILILTSSLLFEGSGFRGSVFRPLIVIMSWSMMASTGGGFWLLGTRNPSTRSESGRSYLHWAVRLAAIAGALYFVAASWLFWPQLGLVMFMYGFTVVGGTWSALRLISEMSLLVPSARLCLKTARRARHLACIAACVVIAGILHAISLHPASITAPYAHVSQIAGVVAIGFLWLYTAFALFVLTRFRPVLKEIAKRARAA